LKNHGFPVFGIKNIGELMYMGVTRVSQLLHFAQGTRIWQKPPNGGKSSADSIIIYLHIVSGALFNFFFNFYAGRSEP